MINRCTKILLCGAGLSGNIGGQALYDSIVDELGKSIAYMEISVLSKYPEDDEKECDERNYHMIAFPTVEQLIFGGCFYIFGGILKKMHLPYKWLAGKRIKPYFENDILVDASGIAFTDDRSLPNILINALWLMPAVVSDIPIVKVSQTLGPYRKWYVRLFSNMVLKHVDVIICRGQQSYEYTKEFLKRDHIFNCPDTAFCLKPGNAVETEKLLQKSFLKPQEYIAIGPSFVMRDFLKSGKYAEIVAECINRLSKKTDKTMVFVPHSRKHSPQIGVDSVDDDVSVCRDIIAKLNPGIKTVLIDEKMSARELKSIIGNAYITIGSRYHFLIAALSSGVPSMALGWSHKYRELFREFKMTEYVLEYNNMSTEPVCSMAENLLANRDAAYALVKENLPEVIRRSSQNEDLIVKCLLERQS